MLGIMLFNLASNLGLILYKNGKIAILKGTQMVMRLFKKKEP
jgi:hypothetical protein